MSKILTAIQVHAARTDIVSVMKHTGPKAATFQLKLLLSNAAAVCCVDGVSDGAICTEDFKPQ